jgi:alanine racemase
LNIASKDIARIVKGRLIGPDNVIVSEVVIDSRQLSFTEGLAFFAIRGKNHDGHDYLESLYDNGVKVFVVEVLPKNTDRFQEAALIVVENSVSALQMLAAHVRKCFKSTVIAVTGSSGKTIVKEWLADVLGNQFPVIRSPKSFNSQVGVPLSVLKLDERYRMAVFEAGISMPGEMQKLQLIINPDVGVITNIGDAHRENFPDDRVKAREKLLLFRKAGVIIYCSDHEIIRSEILGDPVLRSRNLVDWSLERADATAFVEKKENINGQTCFSITYKGKVFDFIIPFTDRASVENAITVAVVCLATGISSKVIVSGLVSLVSVAMRMELKNGINNCQLIEDYYNSDPGSLGMALEYLKSQQAKKNTLILSDFVQSGRPDRELLKEVAGLVRRTGINRFIGIGKGLEGNRSYFQVDAEFFRSTDDFIGNFDPSSFRDETILLKGARIFEFEKIGKLLEQQIHQTILEINLNALENNINEFRRHLEPGTRIMAMVKAFAYGAGSVEIARTLEYQRVNYLAVAYADEGVVLREGGVTLPIMVMNPDPAADEMMIHYSLEPEIFSFSSFRRFTSVASRHGLINYPVHIKIDTGMHRLGFLPDETEELAELILKTGSIKVVSVFSHLSASENPSLDKFTHRQVEVFLKVASRLAEATGYHFLRHILNSSGIARFPQYQFEMVRPGIGMYGVGHLPEFKLNTTGRFVTTVSQVKHVPAGEPVGYGCEDVAEKDRTLAVLPVGYADGLNRKLGNRRGFLFIKERRVPIVGNVCMDMCMVDITGMKVEEGDEAEVFGNHIPIEEIAELCDTIPYEILTSIPGRVKRIFFRD